MLQLVETVRCVVENDQGNILLLKKTDDSKALGGLKFPGGKIDDIKAAKSSPQEQLQAVCEEVAQETGLDIEPFHPRRIVEFSYEFAVGEQRLRRLVHLFHVVVPFGDIPLLVNQTKNEAGGSEDKHQESIWVPKNRLLVLQSQGQLLGNSQRFEFLFN